MENPPRVAVVGATGLVGRMMVRMLEERKFPVARLSPLASPRSAGTFLSFNGSQVRVEAVQKNSFHNVDIALFSAGASVSKEFAPIAAEAGAVVIDNSSAFRMDPSVPLVVPEVNPGEVQNHRGIIANPNCSTIQMVLVLKPLHSAFGIRRVVVSTYQSVSGAGRKGLNQLEDEIAGRTVTDRKFPHPIAFNVIPHIDIFLEGGHTREEWKMMKETSKIMGDEIPVSATCVRVPVPVAHSESANIEMQRDCPVERVREILRKAPGVVIVDEPEKNKYPLAVDSQDRDEVFVGRIRKDPTVPHGINLWIVADNVRKGAATNAVQIAELLLTRARGTPAKGNTISNEVTG
ncbi:MAG TPA: aspartate-semialdehyde dehydrogenase [Bacteroidota bacterium]|nr:aspartate-semialdehyde dehydrogenase [Bacteroidota bacterium]